MAAGDLIQSALQQIHAQWPMKPQRQVLMIVGAAGRDLIQKPEPLLSIGKRVRLGDLARISQKTAQQRPLLLRCQPLAISGVTVHAPSPPASIPFSMRSTSSSVSWSRLIAPGDIDSAAPGVASWGRILLSSTQRASPATVGDSNSVRNGNSTPNWVRT